MSLNDDNSSGNLLVFILLLFGFMLCFNYFVDNKSTNQVQITEAEDTESEKQVITVAEAMANASRIYLANDFIGVSIDLNGCVIDNVILKKYKDSANGTDNVMLLTPRDTEHEFFYNIQYKNNKESITDINSSWSVKNKSDNSVTLMYQTNTLLIERTITLDEHYLINVVDKITNVGVNNVKLKSTSLLQRKLPTVHNYAVVHEGVVGLTTDNSVDEIKYDDLLKSSQSFKKWCGFTDIHWLVSHINCGNGNITCKTDSKTYECALNTKTAIQADNSKIIKYKLFAGPKSLQVLNDYKQRDGVDKFDMAIDFGWFFMLTKPLLYLLEFMQSIFSNMGIVIIMLTVLLKLLTFPLTKKSYTSAAKMRKIQPKIAELQKMYAYDKQKMNIELMQLYKKENVSPLSGCLPMLLQAPIFFCLYKVFFISLSMRHAPFFGWINDLSAPDPVYLFNLFGFINWTPPSFLKIGIWPIIMGATMFIQQKLSAKPQSGVEKTQEAKIQENMMYVLPIIFTYVCSSFPVGVVIYWTISNIIGVIQQYYANKKALS